MSKAHSESAGLFWAALALLIVAIGFGGGGSKYGGANLIVQLVALIGLSFHRKAFISFWASGPLALKVLIVCTALLPVLQIIPLPPAIWNGFPGRELMVQSLDLVGANGWAATSVDPIRTLLALTALIAPLAMLTIGWNTPKDKLLLIGWAAVALGLLNFLIGIPQVMTNSAVGVLYPENPMPGVLFGTFANRNSTGLFLVGTLALAVFLPLPPRLQRFGLWLRPALSLLLLVAIVLTRSRTAIVLAAIPLSLAALQFLSAKLSQKTASPKHTARRLWAVLIPAILLVGVIGTALSVSPGRLADVAERFEDAENDSRAFIWEDAAYSADRYWPIGSGMGTFDDVFQIDESLENMAVLRAGRAHNDYLEVAIEAGAPGLFLVAAWIALALWLAWRARRSRDRWIAWGGASILILFALQSITDYPLRNQSLLVFGSFALVLLVRFGAPSGPSSGNGEERP